MVKITFINSCLLLALSILNVSCVSLFSGEEEITDKVAKQISRDQKSADQAREWLKTTQKRQADIIARLDQIEFQNRQYLARIKILEKGMVLGLVPEELRTMFESGKHQPPKKESSVSKKHMPKEVAHAGEKEPQQVAEVVPVKLSTPQKTENAVGYETQLAEAQKLFADGKYGAAILAYESLSKNFPKKAEAGTYAYWMGVSWMYLKEYRNAKNYLEQVVTINPKGVFVPRAKVHLAKIERKMGFDDRALQKLKDIIATYPDEDAADMARLEIESMKKSL